MGWSRFPDTGPLLIEAVVPDEGENALPNEEQPDTDTTTDSAADPMINLDVKLATRLRIRVLVLGYSTSAIMHGLR